MLRKSYTSAIKYAFILPNENQNKTRKCDERLLTKVENFKY